MTEDIGEDTAMLHLGQGVLDDDADAREQGVSGGGLSFVGVVRRTMR